jgi:hypothetical protein
MPKGKEWGLLNSLQPSFSSLSLVGSAVGIAHKRVGSVLTATIGAYPWFRGKASRRVKGSVKLTIRIEKESSC